MPYGYQNRLLTATMLMLMLMLMLMPAMVRAAGNPGFASYKITDLAGRVNYLPPMQIFWQQARAGQALPAGSLVHVEEGARLGYITGRKDVPEITVATPIVFRVDGDEIRDVRFRTKFIATLPEVPQYGGLKVAEDPELNISNAWDRLVVIATGGQKQVGAPAGDQKMSAKAGGFGGTLGKEKLKLVTPGKRVIRLTTNRSGEVTVRWKTESDHPDAVFEVLSSHEDGEERVETRTRNQSYRLRVDRPGQYKVRVRSLAKDRPPVEDEVTFGVTSGQPLADDGDGDGPVTTGGEGEVEGQVSAAPVRQLRVHSPPAGFVLAGSRLPLPVDFSWEAPPDDRVQLYRLSLRLDGEDKPRQISTSATLHRVTMDKPGTWFWRVTGLDGQDKARWRSPWRRLQLNPPGLSLTGLRTGVIYLHGGLDDL